MRRGLIAFAFAILMTPPVQAAGPVCALLDPEKMPQAPLLEAKLHADGSATWVDRAEIDKVLKEQKLQALFSPQGVGERVRLGKLLKADLLIMIRPVKGAEQPATEIVVSETAGGLRLLLRAVPVTKDAGADVAALLAAAKDGIRKHGEKVTEVVAVPPFASNDLEFTYDHLKGAYAKLAESVALDRKGVVVVEIEEAQALAKELALAAPGARVDRPTPVYLIGEYRHEGKGKDRTVGVKLRAERGGKPVGKPESFTTKPADAPGAIRAWATGVLDAAGGAPAALSAPEAESKRLAEFSRLHRRLGNWSECVALVESSLLLNPKQPELNADATELLQPMIRDILRPNRNDPDRLRRALALHQRGLEHLEALVVSGAKLDRYDAPNAEPPFRLFTSEAASPSGARVTPQARELMEPVRLETVALYARLAPVVAKQARSMREEIFYVHHACADNSIDTHYQLIGSMLLALQDLPGTRERMDAHLRATKPNGLTGFPPCRKMLDRLEAEGNADVKAAVADARRAVDASEKRYKDLAAKWDRYGAEPSPGKRVTPADPATLDAALQGGPFQFIRLGTGKPGPDSRLHHIRGILRAGADTDVLWADGAFTDGPLFLMKEKGKLRQCYKVDGKLPKYTSVVFDGRYVWAAVERDKDTPVVIVLDPAAEKVYEVTERDGLPASRDVEAPVRAPAPKIVALEPGRVCISGSFGRAWVAVATFDPAKRASVKVIHEARDAQDGGDPVQWKKSTVAFHPAHLFTLRGKPGADGKAGVRVLVVRSSPTRGLGTPNNSLWDYPLVVDPDTGTVEVLQMPLPGIAHRFSSASSGDSVFLAQGVGYQTTNKLDARILRVDYPGTVHDVGPAPTALRAPALYWEDGELHLVKRTMPFFVILRKMNPKDRPADDRPEWWVADANGKDFRKLDGSYPSVHGVGTSAHYGRVVLLDLQPEIALCAVINRGQP